MGYVTWSYDTLNAFCKDVFQSFGFSEQESEEIKDVLLKADLYGIESHGMQRMVRYHKGIQKGTIHPEAKPEVVFETPISAVIDGHNGMGQLISIYAMKKAIEKAKTTGVGIVSVRNSNHFGIAGYYAKMACDEGLMGMACTNSEAIMVPTFGRKAMLGSNPIAVAMPADPYPFFFDCSTTVVTRGKLEMYNKMNKPLPEGWALDKDGHASTNAPDVLSNIVSKKGGGIMPLGGNKEVTGSHKGYGYGMICELFSSILSMGVTLISVVLSRIRRVSVMDLWQSIQPASATRTRFVNISPSIWKPFVKARRQKERVGSIPMARRKSLPKKRDWSMEFQSMITLWWSLLTCVAI